ncbi:hypothetical protein [Streptomyces sp. Rer75]|uniref:hypothetical protein n=1 Tax=unclassified Streptomyces TaxID=2593676 RepID=UPI00211EE688|nr:hypothetical protein [Streptomyces sp. Rer75]
MPDGVVVFLVSLTVSVWDRTRSAGQGKGVANHRRRPGTSPTTALAAHIGMGGTMATMLLMMAA